jgi:chromosome partitioning protein
MFDDRTNLAQQVASELKRFLGDRLLTTTIPRNVRLAEAPSHGKPAILYDAKSRGAERYVQLAKEIVSKHMPEFQGFEELLPTPVPAEHAEEKKAFKAPHWRKWREKSKLVTMNLNG